MPEFRYRIWKPKGAEGRLPVLYLLHGSGAEDDESTWLREGRGNLPVTLERLVAGKTVPSIAVVTPFGRPADVRIGQWGFPEIEGFHAYVLALIRAVESDPALSIRTDRAGRAIAGLSMGGWQAIAIFLRSPEMFSAVGNFSGTVQMGFNSSAQPQTFNRPLRPEQVLGLSVFYHTCGRQDQRFYDSNVAFVAELDAAGISNTHDFPDGAHDWPFWQRSLERFAKCLGASGWGTVR
ncbi:MAG: esterase [Nitrospira sp.]